MIKNSLESIVKSLSSEIQMLLRFQLAYDRIILFKDLENITRSDFVDRLIALKAIENDILIRICKFDDINKDSVSFRKIEPLILEHKSKDIIIKNFEIFKSKIHELKKIRRNKQLAHLDYGYEDNDYQIKYDFRSILELLVKTVDIISEKEQIYIWKDGSNEKFNLVEEVLKKHGFSQKLYFSIY
jgi:hypothetical protein